MSDIALSSDGIRKLPEYQAMLRECSQIRRDTSWTLLLGYYQIAATVRRYEDSGRIKREFGKSTISALAEDLHMATSVLYASLVMVDRFPTVAALEKLRADCEKQGYVLTITYMRNNVLPRPMDRPEKYGGMEAIAESAMAHTEMLAQNVDELTEVLKSDQVSEDQKRQLLGVIQKGKEVIDEAIGVLIDFSPQEKTARDSDYLSYIRRLPCIICNGQAEPHHAECGGVGMKGSDYVTVPLCHAHHSELHNSGRETFQRLYALDLEHIVIECLVGYISLQQKVFEGREK